MLDAPDFFTARGAGFSVEATITGCGAAWTISAREALDAAAIATLPLLAEICGFDAKLASIGLGTATVCEITALVAGGVLLATADAGALTFASARFGGSLDVAATAATEPSDRARSLAATLPNDSCALLGS
ncbi:MAG: hypothetical protein ACRD4S_11070 [Candidatus Acidiferrales bacterium]